MLASHRAGSVLGSKNRLARDLMQLDVTIAARAGGGGISGDQRKIAVAQETRIGVEFETLVLAAEQAIQRLTCRFSANIPQRDFYSGIGVDELPLRPSKCTDCKISRDNPSMSSASRPITSGATMLSSAALVAGIAAWPKASPHPISPVSVSTLTRRISR